MSDQDFARNLPQGKYYIINKIGGGTQGAVYLVKDLNNKNISALKILRMTDIDAKTAADMNANMQNEFKILHNLNHRNIISVTDFGFSDDNSFCFYSMEYLSGLNLTEYLRLNNSEEAFLSVTYQALCGLAYLHSNHILHYDIKPENIIIIEEDGLPVLKILDFGLSDLKMQSKKSKIRGTLNFMAPEFFINGSAINEKIDIYALGISLLTSFVGKESFSDHSITMTGSQILKHINNRSSDIEKQLLCIENRRIKQFLNGLIQQNQALRVSSAVEGIRILNLIFSSSFEIPDLLSIQSFATNSAFLLREKQLLDVTNFQIEYDKQNIKKSVIIIKGEKGSGKTKIVDQYYYNEIISGRKIIRISIEDSQDDKLYVFNTFLKILSKELPNRFGENELIYNPEKYHSVDEVYNFLKNSLASGFKDLRSVLIFDDVERYDGPSIDMIAKMILSSDIESLSFILLFDETLLPPQYQQLISSIQNKCSSLVVTADPLSVKEINHLKQKFMGDLFHEPEDFSRSIHSSTEGNFLKVMQFFDWLVDLKIIHRVQNVFTFDNEPFFRDLINKNFSNSFETKLNCIDAVSKDILAILCLSIDSISENSLVLLYNQTDRVLETASIENLIAKGMIRRRSHEPKEISISSDELHKYMLTDFYAADELKKHLDQFKSYDWQNSQHAKTKTGMLITILQKITPDDSETSEVGFKDLTDFCAKLSSRKKEIALLLAKQIATPDTLFELKVIIALAKFNSDHEHEQRALQWLDKAEKHAAMLKDSAENAEFALLRIQLFSDKNDHHEFYEFVMNNIAVVYKYHAGDKFYKTLLPSTFNLLNIDKKMGESLYNIIKQKLALEVCISPEYGYLINIVEYAYNFKPFKEENWIELETQMTELVENNVISQSVVSIMRFYTDLVLKQKQKNYKNEFIEKTLQDLISKMDAETQQDLLSGIFNVAVVYFYNIKDFEKAFSFLSKQYNIVKKQAQNKSNSLLGNMAIIKISLFHNINEIMEIFDQSTTYYKQYGPIHNLITNYFNYSLCCFKAGKFSLSKKYLLLAFAESSQTAFLAIRKMIDRLNFFVGYIITEEEYRALIGNLFNKSIISSEDRDVLITCAVKTYQRIIDDVIDPEDPIYSLCGEIDIGTPGLILKYLKEHNRMPDSAMVFGETKPEMPKKNYIGDYLLHLIVRYMMKPQKNLLPEIYDYCKKMELAGYQIRVYEYMISFVEFLFINNTELGKIKRFLVIQRNAEYFIQDNMDDKQKEHFKNCCLHKKSVANFKTMKIAIENSKNKTS